MSRFARHLDTQDGPHNPFPGLPALERRLGHALPHRIGSNEGLDMPHRALSARFGPELAALARTYGDAEAWSLRTCLGQALDLPRDALLVDAGADSLMALTLRALCDSGPCDSGPCQTGSPVITSAGTYPTWSYFVRGHGCREIEVDYASATGHLAPDLDALAAAAVREGARVVYLANPDNPSGHLHRDADVLALRDALPDDCTLVLDEAYHDFRDDAWAPAASAVWPGVIRLRTFSKAHGLAGLRVGYAIAPPETLAVMMKVRIHYAVSSLALAAAETLLTNPEETRAHVAAVIQRREALSSWLAAQGAEVLPSATNFVAVRLDSAERAAAVHRRLLDEGTLIHRPAHPALGHLLRISALEDALVPGRLDGIAEALR
ncbi:aminotransferase class I/II-fold pyridoxal phosphate-dependent enzyme [Salinicola endophyticus]|uniref:histidinol-phosphate transaminase n=1 Tax=Salinicola endophyticus TaxID=1949083 RepID=A0ABY8FDW2_9GAMM|nr:aminotransferase class I/II-fold pyridoxal phosphate-dependent enzyme [Salinicola endophyticus]WFF41008.1 aminotransferase class I/II-fold pyridoxal phosphate-dependent enzyme [Salinicola endophyticus]